LNTRSSRNVLFTLASLIRPPDEVVLLHVQRLEGRSLMIDMLGKAEMSELKEALKETEHQKALDRRAGKVLDYYRKKLLQRGGSAVRTVLRAGDPAEEILDVAGEEGVDLIILGKSPKKRIDRLITGSVAREVEKEADVPVMTARRTVICEEPYSWGDAYAAISALTIVVFALLMMGFLMGGTGSLP
jgi:nucleotide-binding universal stress UspA family protein